MCIRDRVCIALAVLQSVSILGCAQSGQRLTPPFFVNQPFAQGSPFNIELPANPKLDPESTSIINGLNIMAAGNVWGLQPGTTGWTLEAAATPADSDFSFPVYFSVSTDPLYTINCNGCTMQGLKINIPTYAMPEPEIDAQKPSSGPCENGDHHMSIINSTTYVEYDMYQACPPTGKGGTYNITTGGFGHIYGPYEDMGIADYPIYYNTEYSGYAQDIGSVRVADIMNGAMIPHALQMQVPCAGNPEYPSGVWPAQAGISTDQDCSTNPNVVDAPYYGMRVKLNLTDAQINALRYNNKPLSPYETSILLTLEHYGAFVSDTGTGGADPNTGYIVGDMEFIRESGLSYTQGGLTDPWITLAKKYNVPVTSGGTDLNEYLIPVDAVQYQSRNLTDYLVVVDPCVTWGTC